MRATGFVDPHLVTGTAEVGMLEEATNAIASSLTAQAVNGGGWMNVSPVNVAESTCTTNLSGSHLRFVNRAICQPWLSTSLSYYSTS